MIGQSISHYKILAKLGEGGMGVVYKAEDTKLGRHLVLKFLTPYLTRDQQVIERFINEAKAASALDHPNICTIYEIGESEDGRLFIAMAYYEGETLRKKMDSEQLAVAEAVEIATQVAQGLARAHEAGVIHRDIKPANIMITKREEVKILDFGLAKLVGQQHLTKSGATMGTIAYMSPEQAQGLPVDHRTDLWSLGVVMYEMLTGQMPFKGEYDQAVMYAIVNADPDPPTKLRSQVPVAFEQVIDRALAKDTNERHQSVEELLSEIQQAQREPDKPLHTSYKIKKSLKSWRKIGFVRPSIGLLILLFGIFGYLQLQRREKIPRLINPHQVTTAIGMEEYPAWSPDGSKLAFQANQTGNWDIWVVQPGKGEPVNLTETNPGFDIRPSWSPDGSQIAFWSDRDGPGLYFMSALGGVPRKILTSETGRCQPQWSKDGTEIAYVTKDSIRTFINFYSLQTGKLTSISVHAGEGGISHTIWALNWSPHGDYFALVDALGGAPIISRLWIFRIADKKLIPVTTGRTNDASPSWSKDERYLYFTSNRGGSMDLWQQRIANDGSPNGAPLALTTGVGILQADFSPDGKYLAYSQGREIAKVWRISIPPMDSIRTWKDAEQVTFDEALVGRIALSHDGKYLFFNSDRLGNQDIWRMPATGGKMQQLTDNPAPDAAPAISPDDKVIAFQSHRNGTSDIWLAPASGGTARFLFGTEDTEAGPSWSPDGREIVFQMLRNSGRDLYATSMQGIETRRLTERSGFYFYPQWSPNGKWIAFQYDVLSFAQIWKIPAQGGRAERITEKGIGRPLWSPDGQKIYFLRDQHESRNLWEVTLKDGRERQLTNLQGRYGSITDEGCATDGRQLYFNWQEGLGDIWVMEVAKND